MIATQANQPDIVYSVHPVYPPSILMIEDDISPGKLKQKLERNNYQITWTNLGNDSFNLARWVDFDLILFNLGQCEPAFIEMCHHLLNDPQLTKIPIVIITSCPQTAIAIITPQRSAPVYYLPNDSQAEAKLLHIVDQVHYISYRYI